MENKIKVEKYYHTQEQRREKIEEPVFCNRKDAWLGSAYYFWEDVADATFWGQNSKRGTGRYEIYEAEIIINNFLDTVFNREHYEFWKSQIEKIAKIVSKKNSNKPSIIDINKYLKTHNKFRYFDGILFQDLPANNETNMVKNFHYRKRIQLALYNKEAIVKFIFYDDGNC